MEKSMKTGILALQFTSSYDHFFQYLTNKCLYIDQQTNKCLLRERMDIGTYLLSFMEIDAEIGSLFPQEESYI